MRDHDAATNSPLSRRLIVVLALLGLVVFLNYIDRSNLSIAAPLLKNELGLSATQLGFLLSAFFWMYACLQILVGWLVDRLEVKWVFAAGFFIWSSATAATGFLHTFAALLAARAVLGIGESVAFPSFSKIIANHFSDEHRGLANAVVAAGLCFGPSFGLLFGGTLMGRFGWRPFFIILGSVSLLWLIPWLRWMPRIEPKSTGHDKAGPGFREIVFRRAWLATALGLFSTNYTNYFLLTWLPYYLVHERNFSMTGMAAVGGAVMFCAALSAIICGRLSDRWISAGATNTRVRTGFLIVGCLSVGIFLVAAAIAPRNISIALLCAAGISYGLISATIWAVTQSLAGPQATGRWAGAQNFVGNLAGAIGPTLTGVLVDRTGHFLWPFVITGAVIWGGAAVWAFLLGPIEPVVWKEQELSMAANMAAN